MVNSAAAHQVVVVGGGAGGIELATKLGNRFGKKKGVDITLIDSTLTHIWKPLLHEIASGTLDSHRDDLEYLAQAKRHGFNFRLGRMDGLDRKKQEISLAPTIDEDGVEFIPRRCFKYDTLIIAIGSTTNDFGVKGVAEHCFSLDTREQAEKFHSQLLKQCYIAQTSEKALKKGHLHIAIAGAGATGVELAAELHESTRMLVDYGLDIDPDQDLKITLIEAADTVLPSLSSQMSESVVKTLQKINVEIRTSERITEATADGFHTDAGDFIAAGLKVWAAGIKAPDFLKDIDGLETNHINQLVVHSTLQTSRDENVFAFADCAQCPVVSGSKDMVPPRAQSAHQQAAMLVKTIKCRLKGKPLPEYKYVDFGALINLSSYTTVANMMGVLMLQGLVARFIYKSLYKMHLTALHGYFGTLRRSLAHWLLDKPRRRLKFH
ncbi:MAG: NAD(P)/FAD-dependent oxidoreductase [Gammaproteobacteria bacterium]|nr:NAD(P)/FAD-dependent oxidoreductase [Gammaproteobacteria bacterium]